MRKTNCIRCGEPFIEEHDPDNFTCDKCWDKINNGETEDEE